jgi:hypothetical protein
VRLAGDLINETDMAGEPIVGDTLYLALNAGDEGVTFRLPPTAPGQVWELLFDTADDALSGRLDGDRYAVTAHAMAAFRTRSEAVISGPTVREGFDRTRSLKAPSLTVGPPTSASERGAGGVRSSAGEAT